MTFSANEAVDFSVLASTFFLTLLLLVGLIFFIRASIKDRTVTRELVAEEDPQTTIDRVKTYFESRSYNAIASAEQSGETRLLFEGAVRPSWFLSIFLTLLAACGWFCLSLVLSFLLPSWNRLFYGLTLLSPLAGVFYWRGAGRVEQVALKIAPYPHRPNATRMTIAAHRDELLRLRRQFPLQPLAEGDAENARLERQA